MLYAYIAFFGLLGIFSRLYLDNAITKHYPDFPMGTFVVNMLGCFLVGVLLGLSHPRLLISHTLHIALVVGFCGGFTTFSAYALQSVVLLEKGQTTVGLFYGIACPLLGMLAAWLGTGVTKFLVN